MKRAYLLLHIAVLLAGFTGVFGKLIQLNQIVLVFYRTLFAAVILAIIMLFIKNKPHYSLKSMGKIAFTGFIIMLHWIFFYGSIKHSNVSIGVVCFCLTGFFTSLLSPLFQKRKIDFRELGLSLLVLMGIFLIFSFDTSYRYGILLGIISALFASIFTLLNEKLIAKYDVWKINFYQIVTAAICSGILIVIYKHVNPKLAIVPTKIDAVYLLLLAFFCTVLLYVLVLTAQKKVSAFTVNLSFNLEPIYSILMAMILFQENKVLHPTFYIGCSLIVLSITIQMYRLVQKSKKHVINI